MCMWCNGGTVVFHPGDPGSSPAQGPFLHVYIFQRSEWCYWKTIICAPCETVLRRLQRHPTALATVLEGLHTNQSDAHSDGENEAFSVELEKIKLVL